MAERTEEEKLEFCINHLGLENGPEDKESALMLCLVLIALAPNTTLFDNAVSMAFSIRNDMTEEQISSCISRVDVALANA